MTKFGDTLRKFRQASNDADRLNKRLSQERLGRLIGDEMGDYGYSGTAISDWERGESKIHTEDRQILIALLKVLHTCGGLKTLDEANGLLEAGNYRALDTEESQQIFTKTSDGTTTEESMPKQKPPGSILLVLLQNLFSISDSEFQTLLAKAEKGPPPAWPRIMAAFMGKASENLSLSVKGVLWLWVWLIAWWFIGSSLQLPFADRSAALIAMGKYAAGTLIVPLLIGSLINTKDNDYWKTQTTANSFLVRLYTYQGAGIGFNVGYFLVFPLALVRHYFQFGSSVWIEIGASMLGLILGNMAARVVPHNLWHAYGRLALADGWIFFIVAFLGPLWAIFFLEYYPVLLAPVLGTIIIFSALTAVVIISVWQSRKQITQDQ